MKKDTFLFFSWQNDLLVKRELFEIIFLHFYETSFVFLIFIDCVFLWVTLSHVQNINRTLFLYSVFYMHSGWVKCSNTFFCQIHSLCNGYTHFDLIASSSLWLTMTTEQFVFLKKTNMNYQLYLECVAGFILMASKERIWRLQ